MKRKITVPTAILLVLFVCLLMLPFYVLLVGSFKTNITLISLPIDLNPFKNLTLKNFDYVFKKSDILNWLKNSMHISVGVSALTAAIGVTAGYAFARFRFRFKRVLFMVVMATMMMPKQILLIPNYLVAYNLKLTNNLLGLILTTAAPAYAIFLSRQFIMTLPKDLFDAAEIDGCGELNKFLRIALPLAMHAVGTVAIFAFFNTFNDYLWQLIMISDKGLRTLPIGIAMFSGTQATNKAAQLTVSFLSTGPLIIMFLLFQKFFIKGATDGAIKG